jgi:hypothetical protein
MNAQRLVWPAVLACLPPLGCSNSTHLLADAEGGSSAGGAPYVTGGTFDGAGGSYSSGGEPSAAGGDSSSSGGSPTTSAGGTAGTATDLPPGFEGARSIVLSQTTCAEYVTDYLLVLDRLEWNDDQTGGRYHYAMFRCEQQVCGYLQNTGATYQLLIQPCEMHPGIGDYSRCDCYYTLEFATPTGAETVEVWRRWDELVSPTEPVFIGTLSRTDAAPLGSGGTPGTT